MSELEIVGYTEQYLQELNTLLHSAYITPIGAYCMGISEAIYRNVTGKMPHVELLRLAADCTSVQQAVDITAVWIRERHKIEGGGLRS